LLFFVLALFAALTSSVSLLEISVGWVTEKFGVSRVKASFWIGVLVFLIGLLSALSFNVLADQRPLAFVQGFENATWFDAIDGVTGRLLLPLSGLITAIFIGWVADRKLVNAETGLKGGALTAWRFLVAWLCPLAVAAILVKGPGVSPGLSCFADAWEDQSSLTLSTSPPRAAAGLDIVVSSVMSMPLASFECQKP